MALVHMQHWTAKYLTVHSPLRKLSDSKKQLQRPDKHKLGFNTLKEMPWFISKVLLQLASFSNKVPEGNYFSGITDACRLRAVVPLSCVLRSRLIPGVWMNSYRAVDYHINKTSEPFNRSLLKKKNIVTSLAIRSAYSTNISVEPLFH